MAKRVNPLAIVLILSAAFFAVFIIISVAVFKWMPSDGETVSAGGSSRIFGSKDSIGVLEVRGIILDSKKYLKHLRSYEEADHVKAVVVRLDSPGGAVAPSQEVYEALKKMKKPVVASMGSVAASGAYYIACGADHVFANAGTITGSIGVIMEFVDLTKLYDWAKIRRFSLSTGKFKSVGADYRKMKPEERALLQGMIGNVLGQFKGAVADARGLSKGEVDRVSDGRIFSGDQALKSKLVDETGTFQDAVDKAAELAEIKGKPAIVYPRKKKAQLWEMLLEDRGDDDFDSLISRLISALENRFGFSEVQPILPTGLYWLWDGAR